MTGEPDEEEFVSSGIREIEFATTEIRNLRDPFMRPFPEELTLVEDEGEERSSVIEEDVDLGPLANYTVSELEVVGILTRQVDPLAMISVPDSPLDVFAREGDRVGPNGSGRISDIEPNRVIVSYENLLLTGEPAQTVEIRLREPEEDLQNIDFDPY